MNLQQVGGYALIVGVILAILAGLISGVTGLASDTAAWIILILVILGLIVGLLNIKDKEVFNFLIAVIALIAVGAAGLVRIDQVLPPLGSVLQAIVSNITVLAAPAGLVAALKAVYTLASVKGMPLAPK
jgi:hypothetical protein